MPELLSPRPPPWSQWLIRKQIIRDRGLNYANKPEPIIRHNWETCRSATFPAGRTKGPSDNSRQMPQRLVDWSFSFFWSENGPLVLTRPECNLCPNPLLSCSWTSRNFCWWLDSVTATVQDSSHLSGIRTRDLQTTTRGHIRMAYLVTPIDGGMTLARQQFLRG